MGPVINFTFHNVAYRAPQVRQCHGALSELLNIAASYRGPLARYCCAVVQHSVAVAAHIWPDMLKMPKSASDVKSWP